MSTNKVSKKEAERAEKNYVDMRSIIGKRGHEVPKDFNDRWDVSTIVYPLILKTIDRMNVEDESPEDILMELASDCFLAALDEVKMLILAFENTAECAIYPPKYLSEFDEPHEAQLKFWGNEMCDQYPLTLKDIEPELISQIEKAADRNGLTFNDMVTSIISHYVLRNST